MRHTLQGNMRAGGFKAKSTYKTMGRARAAGRKTPCAHFAISRTKTGKHTLWCHK